MMTLLMLFSFVTSASAEDGDYASLLAEAKAALVAGDYKAARDLLTSAEQVAPESTTLIPQKEIARLYFYRGVLYWRASPESAALDAWRQTLTVSPDFQPEPDLLPDVAERDVFLALGDEVKALEQVVVALPEDPGQSIIYIDGRTLEPTDTVVAGSHLVQIRCEDGEIESSWYTYGAPPKDYLVLCGGGAYKTSSKATSSKSTSSKSSSKSTSKSGSSSKPDLDEKEPKKGGEKKEGGGGEVAKNVAGISLIGLGVGGGVVSVLLYDQASQASVAYDKKTTAARENPDVRDAADTYYDEVLLPRYTRFYGASIGSAVLLAGGVTLVILGVEGPMVAPIPGGGVFTWSGRF
ncbi:MAG: hypothetical protein Q8P18_26245 [Pseudomonadota bacterium]|nr:hypothetical protein [Pseudomonadota bacterium]